MLPLLCQGWVFTAYSKIPRLYTPYTTQGSEISVDDELPAPVQREQIFNGIFPAHFSGEEISLRTTRKEFHDIFKAFKASADKRSRTAIVQFNEAFHSTIIRHSLVSVHECLINSISNQLQNLALPAEFSFYGDTNISDEISNSDLQMVRDSNDSGVDPVLAVEVGFSQPSADLEMKIKDLIKKTTVKVAILVDIKETPNYKNPLRIKANKEIYYSEQNSHPGNPGLLIRQYCEGREPYSPVFLYGVRWTGEFTAAVQVFGKGTSTDEPIPWTPKMASALQ
ncbi:hypothetical protein MGYG_06973 [Nannizzia gypsea CBS 118893]|uniref:Uncharacterized protein n=1 Tax=Arthroderma gypseum (strain ATCC MYA-4604 / CBS 118893) TaxID=535722 RepID=E4V1Q6_ARTGP|nr:hypothetical protein MGYG_06973 [Nannizzia gypsea CBS 118893]EFR03971.1 hypothetical protein MGYG_06973 [Nannizzia gypsea CBS 118893]